MCILNAVKSRIFFKQFDFQLNLNLVPIITGTINL